MFPYTCRMMRGGHITSVLLASNLDRWVHDRRRLTRSDCALGGKTSAFSIFPKSVNGDHEAEEINHAQNPVPGQRYS